MSYSETPQQTLLKFDRNSQWKASSEKVLARDFLSANGESNLMWTPFYYEEKDGKLFDPLREQFIAGTANGNIAEEGIITQLQDWFSKHDSGLAVWISPRKPYESEQITLYRISTQLILADDGRYSFKKVLLFSWHQFKHKFNNPEQIRKFIFSENDSEESVLEIISWLRSISEKPVSDNYGNMQERLSRSEYYASKYKSGVPMEQLAYKMDQSKFLGKNPMGCPPTNTSQFYGYTITNTEMPQYLYSANSEWHTGECRKCHEVKWVGGCNICQSCVDLYYS